MERKPAFTFLELLIACSLFAVGMMSIIQIFPLNRRFLSQSSMATQAAFITQEQMEHLFTESYDAFPVASGGTGVYEMRHKVETAGAFSQYERETRVQLLDANHQATTVDQGLKRVTVTVYWSEKNVAQQYVVSTYVAKR